MAKSLPSAEAKPFHYQQTHILAEIRAIEPISRLQTPMNLLLLKSFTILPAENGYRLRVNHGAAEYLWPSTYPTLEKAGEQILKALTTASECRGEL